MYIKGPYNVINFVFMFCFEELEALNLTMMIPDKL